MSMKGKDVNHEYNSVLFLTHCGLVMPYGNTQIWVNIGSGNDLVPDGTKLSPEPMLTSHLWVSGTSIEW